MNGVDIVIEPQLVLHWLLIATRLGGVVATAPLFSRGSTPMRVKAGFVAAFAVALSPAIATGAAAEITDIWTLAGGLVVEAAMGVMIGLVPQLVLAGVMMGGQLAGIHMGLGLSQLVDPVTQINVTPIALWFQFVAMLVFLALDVHHLVLRALVRSFSLVPPGTVQMTAVALKAFLGVVAIVFEIGVRVAAPVLVGLLIIDAGMGLLSRAIPELNVFIMGFAVKMGVAFLLLGASLPYVVQFLERRFVGMDPLFVRVLRAFT